MHKPRERVKGERKIKLGRERVKTEPTAPTSPSVIEDKSKTKKLDQVQGRISSQKRKHGRGHR